MWKDLVDRADRLRENRLVKHLIDGPEEEFAGRRGSEAVEPTEIDRRHSPRSLFAPLPADSSQLAAVIAAAKGAGLLLGRSSRNGKEPDDHEHDCAVPG